MPKPNVETLLDLIQRSGLVEKDRLESGIEEFKKRMRRPASRRRGRGRAAARRRGPDHANGNATRLLEGRHRGFFLGRYKLLGQIGTGG